jgi:hypothetical protein
MAARMKAYSILTSGVVPVGLSEAAHIKSRQSACIREKRLNHEDFVENLIVPAPLASRKPQAPYSLDAD